MLPLSKNFNNTLKNQFCSQVVECQSGGKLRVKLQHGNTSHYISSSEKASSKLPITLTHKFCSVKLTFTVLIAELTRYQYVLKASYHLTDIMFNLHLARSNYFGKRD